MQKLLLLLILSFFSTQGIAASCPDGSEPTKTVSADGTYYEYKCPEAELKKQASTSDVFDVLPCFFNGVKVGPSARLHDGVSGGRCCPTCSAYSKKRGTSLHMPRGTPIVAIADMKVISIYDNSAEQKSEKSSTSLNKKHGEDHYQSAKIMKPFDDIQMFFIDKKGNVILYYHMKETNLVKGFNKGNCKIPHEYQWGKKPKLPEFCGGYSDELIKNNFWVKKGQVIGLSGQTGGGSGGPHISLGVAIPPDEEFRKYLIEMNKDLNLLEVEKNWNNPLVRDPWKFTGNRMRYTAPQRDFNWENLPTNSDNYLFPVMSDKYLKEITNNAEQISETVETAIVEVEEIKIHKGIYNVEQITKTLETAIVSTSDDDPTVSKVIEVIQGDKFIVDISEPHELAGSNIKLFLRDIDAADATKSCNAELENSLKVKDFVTQKLRDASTIKLTNFKQTNTAVLANVIVDGTDLGEELIAKGYASKEYGYWKAYFCNPMKTRAIGNQYAGYGTGSEVDFDKAIFWLERTIFLSPNDHQNAKTIYRLSVIYFYKRDTNKSLDYLKQSASLGWMEAQETLGEAYLYGFYNEIAISKNTSEAKKLLKKAHDQGSKTAEGIYCSSLPKAQQKTCKF